MTFHQSTIDGDTEMNDSPTVVVDKFLAQWSDELQSSDYGESEAFGFFSSWFMDNYVYTSNREMAAKAIKWIMTKRPARTLQERLAHLRSKSGKREVALRKP